MKRISRHYLNKTLRTVAEHCQHGNCLWSDDSLKTFCDNPKNVIALNMLRELGNISILYADNRIYHVGFKSHSYIYLLTRSEKWIERLIGFVAGVASTVLAGLIIFWITA